MSSVVPAKHNSLMCNLSDDDPEELRVVSCSVCAHSLPLCDGLTLESHSVGCGETAVEETVCCL